MRQTTSEPSPQPRALVVYESMFGNTKEIAESIACGLGAAFAVELREVSASTPSTQGVDLLVVGGPVHAFSMSRPATRADARKLAESKERALVSTETGVREWLDTLESDGANTAAAAFDTVVRVGRFTVGSAARAEAKALRRHGFVPIADPEHFLVEDTMGPLKPGERERAVAWGRELTRRYGSRGAMHASSSALPPWQARVLIALTVFGALSAIGGGAELLVFPTGNAVLPPLSILQHTPFRSFAVPGLVLVLLGLVQLASAVSTLRRARWLLELAMIAGGSMTVWIVAEAAMLRELQWLHAVYLVQGALTLGLAAYVAVRAGAPRHRWLIVVTLGEALGFLAPMTVGILTERAGIAGGAQLALLSIAGLVEGLGLGLAQASAFPVPVPRAPFVALSALGAGLAWVAFLSVPLLLDAPTLGVGGLVLAVLCGTLGLTALLGAQALALRRSVVRVRPFVIASALAWVLALPLSFAVGPFVDERTPPVAQLALWSMGGVAMAFVMAMVTWQGARRCAALG